MGSGQVGVVKGIPILQLQCHLKSLVAIHPGQTDLHCSDLV